MSVSPQELADIFQAITTKPSPSNDPQELQGKELAIVTALEGQRECGYQGRDPGSLPKEDN